MFLSLSRTIFVVRPVCMTHCPTWSIHFKNRWFWQCEWEKENKTKAVLMTRWKLVAFMKCLKEPKDYLGGNKLCLIYQNIFQTRRLTKFYVVLKTLFSVLIRKQNYLIKKNLLVVDVDDVGLLSTPPSFPFHLASNSNCSRAEIRPSLMIWMKPTWVYYHYVFVCFSLLFMMIYNAI